MSHPKHDLEDVCSRNPTSVPMRKSKNECASVVKFAYYPIVIVQHLSISTGQKRLV